MTTALITGGMGFIGSNFVRYALKNRKDWNIINLDKLTYAGNPDNLKDIKDKRYRSVRGDIADRKVVESLVPKCDIIVNFAAETHVDRSIIDAGTFVKTDVIGTYRLLETARKYDVERYVQVSTDEVYGSIETGSFTESSPLTPNNPYSASKAGADMLVRAYHTTYGLRTMITRSSNNFGPYQYPEKLIPLFITNAIDSKPLPLYGDGKNVRDWLYVEDNCEAIALVAEKGEAGQAYNVGGGNERTNIEITKLILKALDKPKSLITYVKDRPGHDRRYSLTCDRMRALGWSPSHGFEDALGQTVKWYVNNEWWWRKIMERGRYRKYYRKQYGGEK